MLVGHSIAGEEMSSVSKHLPGRVSALIYLDAGGPFALYNPEHGDIDLDRVELQQDLSKLGEDLYDDAVITKTLSDEARYRRNLQDLRDEVEGAAAPAPTKIDLSSIAAFQKYFAGYYEGSFQMEKSGSTTRSELTVQLALGSHNRVASERRNSSTSALRL